MRHPLFRASLAASLLALVACSSSYHPEYHPVTVSHFSQNIVYPAGGAGPVYVLPSAATSPVLVVPPPEAPPPDFFTGPER